MNWTLTNVPDPQVETAIDLAKKVGTYGKIDRSAQYKDRYDSQTLLRNDNLIFERQRKMENARFWHSIGIILIGAAIAHGPKILAILSRLFQ